MPPAIHHITHLDNLVAIVRSAGLWSNNHRPPTSAPPKSIAHGQIQDRRSRVVVPCGPGGTLHDYVPFYFGVRSPMLYANHVGQVAANSDGQSAIVYLVVDAAEAHAAAPGRCVFTDGHAVMRPLTRYFERPGDVDRLDWSAIGARQWADTPDDPDRKRRKQAEFLIHRFVPWHLVNEIVVLDERARAVVRTAIALAFPRPPVAIRPTWYYEERR